MQHPNIIQVFEVGSVQPHPGEFETSPFIALEFVDGSSLAKLTTAPQSPRFAAHMVETLARAAHAAHRVGVIHPGEAIVLVAALSGHRNEAFEAVRLLMDYLKTDAPLWKKESGPDGARWIEPSAHDQARRTRAGEKV